MDARRPVKMKQDLGPRREAKRKASKYARLDKMGDDYDKRMGGRVSDRDYRKAVKKYQRKTMKKYK